MLVQSFGGDEAFRHQGDSDKLEHYNLVTYNLRCFLSKEQDHVVYDYPDACQLVRSVCHYITYINVPNNTNSQVST